MGSYETPPPISANSVHVEVTRLRFDKLLEILRGAIPVIASPGLIHMTKYQRDITCISLLLLHSW